MDDQVLELELDATHVSSSRARRAVGSWLASNEFPEAHIDDWLVVVSEVVTNAVIHTGTAGRVVVRWNGERVMVEVFDRSPHDLPRVVKDLPAVGGRGLFLVEQLSSSWGVETFLNGKCVWAIMKTAS